MLQRVHDLVSERGFPEEREVPDDEVHRPERQRDERMGEEAERPDRAHGEDRAEQRAGEPGDDAERPEIAEQQVLDHVEREGLLFPERGDRRDERDGDEKDAEPEEGRAPPGDGCAAT